jgi:Amt family ammonium transporter
VEILEALCSGVIVTNYEGLVLYINQAARALTGSQDIQAVGRLLPEVLRLPANPGPRRRIKDSLFDTESGDPCISELTALTGTRHPVQINIAYWEGDAMDGGYVIYEIRDMAASVRRTKRLMHEATHDSLTGLLNRRELRRRLYELIGDDEHGSHVLLILDLDGFKRINDDCGHLAGDEALQDIAGLIKRKMRKADSVARLGGDEFAVLLIGCLLDEALSMAEDLRSVIGNYVFELAGRVYSVTASIGISCVTADTVSIDQAIQRADSACYRAKGAGGNQVYASDDDHKC